MDNSKLPSFSKSDKQMADAFGMSVSDFKKVKKQIVSDMTKPKVTAKVTPKPKPKLSKSEKAFLAGQKKKAQITKKTGVYPNTAN